MKRSWWPLLLFGGLLVMLAAGLGLRPSEVPSPLIGKPAPSFRLPLIGTPEQTLSPQDLRGQVWLLNVWASWCVACRQEHEVVLAASQSGAVPIYGLNYKDRRGDASQWLARFGNPYVASLSDIDGRVGIDFGVYGVPETFLIDKQGIVRHKLTGPLTPEAWRDTLLPLIRKLNG
ncbi:MAG: DsbE family thiol:disulfide interchange protein [Gammaproteobacteria bacterium]|nr:DsbE family thiol:disulfide interchange protein [Gammaproteobacteria bacterium]MBU1444496.1 DsbE family thiol:disulfide interchange protein [Gammaproteobacteria bacterium]MBU2289042.1 DsbE family thiol:disulfide interchange protein [Gammaproteobacteria bacterium]